MAVNVPREVLARAMRNAPPTSSKLPKFGTYNWRAQNITTSAPGINQEVPAPDNNVVVNFAWDTTGLVVTAWNPIGNENDRPRINTWRSDGTYMVYASAGSQTWDPYTYTMSAAPWGNRDNGSGSLVIPLTGTMTAGIDIVTQDFLPEPILSPDISLWTRTDSATGGEIKYRYTFTEPGTYDIAVVLNGIVPEAAWAEAWFDPTGVYWS